MSALETPRESWLAAGEKAGRMPLPRQPSRLTHEEEAFRGATLSGLFRFFLLETTETRPSRADDSGLVESSWDHPRSCSRLGRCGGTWPGTGITEKVVLVGGDQGVEKRSFFEQRDRLLWFNDPIYAKTIYVRSDAIGIALILDLQRAAMRQLWP